MENNIKQTAVEWLEEIVNKNGLQMSDYLKFTFKQAKEIEKQQIIDACWAGGDDGEQYYNATYGGNK